MSNPNVKLLSETATINEKLVHLKGRMWSNQLTNQLINNDLSDLPEQLIIHNCATQIGMQNAIEGSAPSLSLKSFPPNANISPPGFCLANSPHSVYECGELVRQNPGGDMFKDFV